MAAYNFFILFLFLFLFLFFLFFLFSLLSFYFTNYKETYKKQSSNFIYDRRIHH